MEELAKNVTKVKDVTPERETRNENAKKLNQ